VPLQAFPSCLSLCSWASFEKSADELSKLLNDGEPGFFSISVIRDEARQPKHFVVAFITEEEFV
jgi:hypothetical protein